MNEHNKLSAYMIVRNEEDHIAAAVESLSFADEVVIVDTGSTDETLAALRELPVKVVEIPFTGFGETRNAALSHCSHDWIFCMDADERCTPELQHTIRSIVASNPDAQVFVPPRRNYFQGRFIRHSGWYPDYSHPRLFKRSQCRYHNDTVHERVDTTAQVIKLKEALIHYPYKNLEALLAKTNHYSSLGVDRLQQKGKTPGLWSALFHGVWAFVRQYVVKRGFLDGWPGFILAFNSLYATFYRYAKYHERLSSRS